MDLNISIAHHSMLSMQGNCKNKDQNKLPFFKLTTEQEFFYYLIKIFLYIYLNKPPAVSERPLYIGHPLDEISKLLLNNFRPLIQTINLIATSNYLIAR